MGSLAAIHRDLRASRADKLRVRDGGTTCCWCSRRTLGGDTGNPADKVRWRTFEHLIPRAKGGPDWTSNLLFAHAECNRRRGSRTPARFAARQLAEGHQPRLKLLAERLAELSREMADDPRSGRLAAYAAEQSALLEALAATTQPSPARAERAKPRPTAQRKPLRADENPQDRAQRILRRLGYRFAVSGDRIPAWTPPCPAVSCCPTPTASVRNVVGLGSKRGSRPATVCAACGHAELLDVVRPERSSSELRSGG